MVIHGTAYGQDATLEIVGDTLRWRAHRGVVENIVTTVHDVRLARWVVRRTSWVGLTLAAIGVALLVREGVLPGVAMLALGTIVATWRLAKPRCLLVLELGGARLELAVTPTSRPLARRLAARIDHARETGEVPASPPMLP
jgi:hypothetical protein